MNKIELITKKYLRNDLPEIKPGFVVRVWQKFILEEITKGRTGKITKREKKEIVKPFQGIIISIKGGRGIEKTFTVRGEAGGQIIEKIFPYHSPTIEKIEILGISKIRRSKLYFLRKLSPTEIRRKLKTKYISNQ